MIIIRLPARALPIISSVAVLVYMVLPSLAWSFMYRAPKLVLDPLIIAPIEAFLPGLARPILRIAWLVVCGTTLLLEWNIFPESYGFYLRILFPILGTQHGQAVVLTIALLFAYLAIPTDRRFRRIGILVACVVLYATLALLKVTSYGKENLFWLRVPLLRALQVWSTDGDRAFASVLGKSVSPIGHHFYDVIQRQGDQLPPKIMVVLLESWGERPDDLESIGRHLAAMRGIKSVQWGYNAFRGSTLPAEIRELCGRQIDFSRSEKVAEGCLPRRLGQAGYATSALHGYDGFFYSRSVIYPALGFTNIFFRPDLVALASCQGAFSGVCDDAIIDRATALLSRDGRQFVYVMSLSAHAPVAAASLNRRYVRNSHLQIRGDSSQIMNRALIVRAVEDVVRASRTGYTLVYLAGDHNPPGMEQELGLPVGRTPYLLVSVSSAEAAPPGVSR